jgi:hypothetical protein
MNYHIVCRPDGGGGRVWWLGHGIEVWGIWFNPRERWKISVFSKPSGMVLGRPQSPIQGPGVAQWLRHCATSRKVPGSNPGGVGRREFSRGYRQPLKMSTRDFSWGKGGRCVRLTTYHPCSAECQVFPGLNLPGPPWAISTACCGWPLPESAQWKSSFTETRSILTCFTILDAFSSARILNVILLPIRYFCQIWHVEDHTFPMAIYKISFTLYR